jgi:hypothetical protein
MLCFGFVSGHSRCEDRKTRCVPQVGQEIEYSHALHLLTAGFIGRQAALKERLK